MAETATATAPAPAEDKAAAATRPTRPNENAFKEELAKAEKAHKEAMDRLVSLYWRLLVSVEAPCCGMTMREACETCGRAL